jgi:hypothetical protein
MPAK